MLYRCKSLCPPVCAFLVLISLLLAVPGRAHAAAQGGKRFPAVKEQLARDKVIPGTALEKLIQANQDTSVLEPFEQEDDGLGLPLWLRVLWKKSHPESQGRPDDPSGGYPLVLQEAREWMLHHQDLKPVPNDRRPSVSQKLSVAGSSEKRISDASTTLHRSESDIRVFYGNPSRIIAGANSNTTTGHQLQMYSSDSGASWTQTSLGLTGSDSFHSDPAVDWTSDGTAWSTTIGVELLSPSGYNIRVRTYQSTSPGTSWTFDGTPSGTQTIADKELMWVDHSSTSPYKDRIYAIWHANAPTYISRRVSGVWSTPLQVSGTETTGGTSTGSDIKTNANGDVFAFWPSSGTTRGIFVAKSTNGGSTFSSPTQAATLVGAYQIGIPAANARKPVIYVSGGAFRSSSKDMVYAIWMDLNQTGCTAPGSNAASSCKTRIWFSRSTNGGTSWSTPVKINDQAGLNDQFNPWLLVDEKTGALTVIYYDTTGDSTRLNSKVWAQYSGNDGATWSGAVQVSSGSTFEPESYADGYTSQYGDYNGLSGIAGTLFPSWTDRRNGSIEEIWTAKLINPNLEGYHDAQTCEQAGGWAWDRNASTSTLNVDVYDSSTYLGSASAAFFRQDLLNAGIGNGYHAFGFYLPSSLWDGNTHTIRARFGGTTTDLSSTPKTITCTTIFTTQTPQYYLAGSNYENSTNFSSSSNGYIVALRFYKAPGETGTHVGNLWTSTGTKLASVTFTNETSSGWQTQFLSTPVAITSGTTYLVSYGFNNYLAKTDCGLSGGITHGPLTTTGSAYATPNGSFPNTGSCSNFFADVIFSP